MAQAAFDITPLLAGVGGGTDVVVAVAAGVSDPEFGDAGVFEQAVEVVDVAQFVEGEVPLALEVAGVAVLWVAQGLVVGDVGGEPPHLTDRLTTHLIEYPLNFIHIFLCILIHTRHTLTVPLGTLIPPTLTRTTTRVTPTPPQPPTMCRINIHHQVRDGR